MNARQTSLHLRLALIAVINRGEIPADGNVSKPEDEFITKV